MKNLILILTVLLLPICLLAQSAEKSPYGKWSIDKDSRPIFGFIEKYEGIDGKQESLTVTIIKDKGRAGMSIWMITGSVNEPGGINLQVGNNKVINIPYKDRQALIEEGYYTNNGEKVDVLQQLLNSKEATIIFDDAMGMVHIIKVPLADFQKEYAKL